MEKLTKIFLILIAIYLAFQTVSLLFFYERFPAALRTTNFSLEEMHIYSARTIIPAFLLTLLYFIYRYFSGKNPTSALWPFYVALIAFLISQCIGFVTYLDPSFDSMIDFLLTCIVLFFVRKAHQARKKEIF